MNSRTSAEAGPGPSAFEMEVKAPALDVRAAVARAVEITGRSPEDIAEEMRTLRRGPGKLSEAEYFRYRLFETGLDLEAKLMFAGLLSARAVWSVANFSAVWFGPMMQKTTFCTLMHAHGIKAPVVIAQTGGAAAAVGVERLVDAAAITTFLEEPAHYPMFGKPQVGERSHGSLSFERLSEDRRGVHLFNGRVIPVEVLAGEIHETFPDGYLFQRRLVPDETVQAMCGERVATVRVYTLAGASGPKVFRTVWKIPARGNMADNYWRSGNILAAIDRDIGKTWRAVSGAGFERVEIDRHPDSGMALVGLAVPQLADIERSALAAAHLFSDIRLIGWDIAATRDGPVVIEGNFAPDFGIVQIAESRGVLDRQLDEGLDASMAAKRKLAERIRKEVAADGGPQPAEGSLH